MNTAFVLLLSSFLAAAPQPPPSPKATTLVTLEARGCGFEGPGRLVPVAEKLRELLAREGLVARVVTGKTEEVSTAGVEWIVRGKLACTEAKEREGELMLTLSATAATTSREVAMTALGTVLETKQDPEEAARDLTAEATSKLLAQLRPALDRSQPTTVDVTLELGTGTKYAAAQQIVRELGAQPGVSAMGSQRFSSGTVSLAVVFESGKAFDALASRLGQQGATLAGRKVAVVRASSGTLAVTLE